MARLPLTRSRRLDLDRGLRGWTRIGRAFRSTRESRLPASRELEAQATIGGSYMEVPLDAGSQGRAWATSFRPVGGRAGVAADLRGEEPAGALLSPRFRITGRRLSYRLGGDGRGRDERVELWVRRGKNGPFRPVGKLTRDAGEIEQMRQISLDVADQRGSQAVIAVIDQSSFGHVNFDDVRMHGSARPSGPPPPVVGWMDTHTHPMFHQGFGGLNGSGDDGRPGIRSYMGVPGGDVDIYRSDPRQYSLDVRRDQDTHFGGPLARFMVNVIERRRQATDAAAALGSVVGIEFHEYPVGPAHQLMHITEIHRAWEGGLRLISSLAVTNAAAEYMFGDPRHFNGGPAERDLFGAPTERDGPERSVNQIRITPDRDVIEAHVVAMRQLVDANSDWMEIVYTPSQAYLAMRAGRLAVVLGTEVDRLGQLGFPTPEAEVDYLWRLGLRQLTPVHAIDNEIGGAPIFQDAYNTTRDLLKRPMLNAVRNRVNDDVNAQGLAVAPRADFSGRPNFGHFFDVEGYACGGGVPRGECVDYRLENAQGIINIDSVRPADVVGAIPYAGTFLRGVASAFPQPAVIRPGVEPKFVGPYFATPGGHRNRQGLTDYGRRYLAQMIRRGMLIDIEHMSDRTIDAIIDPGGPSRPGGPVWDFRPGRRGCAVDSVRITEQTCFDAAYPIMSSHTSIRGQSLHGRTTVKDWRSREFERTPRQIEFIRRVGGTIAPVVGHDPVEVVGGAPPGTERPDYRYIPGVDYATTSNVANDCAGSSKSWAQAYLLALQKMGGRGVGISTDMPFIGSTIPRFRRDDADRTSCGASRAAADPAAEEAAMPEQYRRFEQRNSVAYAPPLSRDLRSGDRVRELVRPSGHPGNYNLDGVSSYGLLPDLLQDALNIGITERDLAPLFQSAQSYVDMWDKAWRITGCDAPRSTAQDYERCAGEAELAAFTEDEQRRICRNTCPNDPGRGMDRRPDGSLFEFKPLP